MKKLLILLLMPFLTGGTHLKTELKNPLAVSSEEVNIDISAVAGILIEVSSGTVIFQKNAEEKLYPASMTKMMGMLLTLEHISREKLSFTDIITVSPYAASMGGTQVFLQPGETMSVHDLFKSVAINSANDAITALGEAISGSIGEFIKLMNARAKELGMKNTNFVNCTGFHDPSHYSTAIDMAILGRELLKFGQTVLQFTSQYDGYIREDTANPFWLVNTNKLVKHYQGMDGLKTGYTSDSMYCLTATASRNNLRFLTVVMRADTIEQRSNDTCKMLDYAFAHYQNLAVYASNHQITTHTFKRARKKDAPLFTANGVNICAKKGDKFDSLKQEVIIYDHAAPIKAGSIVGQLEVTNSSGWKYRFDLVVNEDIRKSNWLDFLVDAIRGIFIS